MLIRGLDEVGQGRQQHVTGPVSGPGRRWLWHKRIRNAAGADGVGRRPMATAIAASQAPTVAGAIRRQQSCKRLLRQAGYKL